MTNIPGDLNDGLWRAKKFVHYANFVPPVHQPFFPEYAKRRNLTEEQCWFLSFIMGNVYSELTAIFIFEELGMKIPTKESMDKFLSEWNDRIVYGSARKWLRYNKRAWTTFNWLTETTNGDMRNFFKQVSLSDNERLNYDNIQNFALTCPEYGRFASDLFNEILMVFMKSGHSSIRLRSDESINFYDGANLTSGLFNICYMDERADLFDKDGKLTKEENDFLTEKLLWLKEVYKSEFPEKEIDVPLFVTKICSFRNCFKGTRFGGFHHLRQLTYLKKFEEIAPHRSDLWEEMYDIRKTVYPVNLRGEEFGIYQIPKEFKRWWLDRGWIGNETECYKLLQSYKSNTLDEFF